MNKLQQLYNNFADNVYVIKKLNAYKWYTCNNMSAQEISELLEVSRYTVYRWVKQVKEVLGKSVLHWKELEYHYKKRTTRLGRKSIITGGLVSKIFTIRKKYLCGKNKIAEYLHRMYKIKVSASTVGRILQRFRHADPKLQLYWQKYKDNKKGNNKNNKEGLRPWHIPKHLRPMQAIAIDTKYYILLTGNKVYYLYAAIDLKTRMLFAMFYKHIDSTDASQFLKRAIQFFSEYGKLEYIQTDNGSEFAKHFNRVIQENNLKHVYIQARRPYQNGIVERVMRILEEEFIPKIRGIQDININKLNIYLYDYLLYYNTQRIHTSLSYRTPLEYLIKKIKGNEFVATLLNLYI